MRQIHGFIITLSCLMTVLVAVPAWGQQLGLWRAHHYELSHYSPSYETLEGVVPSSWSISVGAYAPDKSIRTNFVLGDCAQQLLGTHHIFERSRLKNCAKSPHIPLSITYTKKSSTPNKVLQPIDGTITVTLQKITGDTAYLRFDIHAAMIDEAQSTEQQTPLDVELSVLVKFDMTCSDCSSMFPPHVLAEHGWSENKHALFDNFFSKQTPQDSAKVEE